MNLLLLNVSPPNDLRNLHRLVELFGELVEAVSESGKRQEECRALEDDTDALLAEGETVHMEVRSLNCAFVM